MYDIYTSKNEKAAVDVYVDFPNPTTVPAAVIIGVGNKKNKYKNWLSNCFKDNGNKHLLHFLAYIHKVGKDKGSVALICKCKSKSFHTEAIKEFLEENNSILDSILPYLFEDAGFKADDKLKAEAELDASLQSEKTIEQKPQLTEEDFKIFNKLIKEHESNTNNSVDSNSIDMSYVTTQIQEQQKKISSAIPMKGELVNDTVTYSEVSNG